MTIYLNIYYCHCCRDQHLAPMNFKAGVLRFYDPKVAKTVMVRIYANICIYRCVHSYMYVGMYVHIHVDKYIYMYILRFYDPQVAKSVMV
jgi:hypothetical protein